MTKRDASEVIADQMVAFADGLPEWHTTGKALRKWAEQLRPAAEPADAGRDEETIKPTDLKLIDVWQYHRDRALSATLTDEARTRHSRMAGVIHAALASQQAVKP